MKHFLLLYDVAPDYLARRAEFREAHLAKAWAAHARGDLVLGGALGKTILDANAVKALAELPSLDQLRAKIVGMIQTPATRIAGLLAAPGGQIARVINAYATKDKAA